MYLANLTTPDGFARPVAVKLLHRRWTEHEEIAGRMRDEARLLGRLRHRHIVDVLDLTMIDGRCAIVMEYLDAVDIRQVVRWMKASGKALPARVAAEIVAAVASALDAAHNRPPIAGEQPLRVIHRDIKPSNIMVGVSGAVKVLDFGVARAEFDSREARTAELSFGSLEYMPPERLFFEPESAGSDIYSLGATFYELLTAEQLGKAKLRQEEQQRFVTRRIAAVAPCLVELDDETAAQVERVLADMLTFDDTERPSARACVERLRDVARVARGPSLEEWAESVVPGLVAQAQEETPESEGSLVGEILAEDSEGFPRDPSEAVTTGGADALVPGGWQQFVEPRADPEDVTSSREDRWQVMKQESLASLRNSGDVTPQTLEDLKRGSSFDQALHGDDFEDELPTVLAIGVSEAHPEREAQPVIRVLGFSDPDEPEESDEDEESLTAALVADETVHLDVGSAAGLRSLPPQSLPPQAARSIPPRSMPPRSMPPRSIPPSSIAPRSIPPRSIPPGSIPPGSVGPRSMPPRSMPPRSIPPSSLSPRGDRAASLNSLSGSTPASDQRVASWHSIQPSVRTETPEQPRLSGNTLIGIVAMLVFVATTFAFTATVVGGAGLATLVAQEDASVRGRHITLPVSAPGTSAPAAEAEVATRGVPKGVQVDAEPPLVASVGAAPAEASVRFASELSGTRRISVRCDSGAVQGATEVVLSGQTHGDCTVTAIGEDRVRRTAVVKDVIAGSYVCFDDDGSQCQ
ncbi:MAG: protein kinase [Myxococcales bacterium]|nr:protein kinase [Myxococcales bacterium]